MLLIIARRRLGPSPASPGPNTLPAHGDAPAFPSHPSTPFLPLDKGPHGRKPPRQGVQEPQVVTESHPGWARAEQDLPMDIGSPFYL